VYLANQVVTVENGKVDKQTIYVKTRGTVQFVNKDKTDYQVRLLMNQERFPFDLEKPQHADVDFMLLALGGSTLVADERIVIGQCKYQLIATSLADLACDETPPQAPDPAPVGDQAYDQAGAPPVSENKILLATSSSKGGGGTIIIGA